MKDYYQILGIPQSSGSENIKQAYKKLALKYHPDRNSGSEFAEQKFKEINEAYQTLSDPIKKAQYDLQFSYSSYTPTDNYRPTQGPKRKTSVYNRYGKFDWRNTPRYHRMQMYVVNKEYYIHQLYALGVVFAIAVISIAGFSIKNYIERLEQERIDAENNRLISIAEANFGLGNYDSTFLIVTKLIDSNPFKTEFQNVQEEYVEKLKLSAHGNLRNEDFRGALNKLNYVLKYQTRTDLKVYRKVADIHMVLKDYSKAIEALDYIMTMEYNNLNVAMEIGNIYNDKLNDNDNALAYYSMARSIFKRHLSAVYGSAFELVVDPTTLDPSYFIIFQKRAKANVIANNLEEAIRDYNWAVFLRPNAARMYHLRAECYYDLNRKQRACSDWEKASDLGYELSDDSLAKYCM